MIFSYSRKHFPLLLYMLFLKIGIFLYIEIFITCFKSSCVHMVLFVIVYLFFLHVFLKSSVGLRNSNGGISARRSRLGSVKISFGMESIFLQE